MNHLTAKSGWGTPKRDTQTGQGRKSWKGRAQGTPRKSRVGEDSSAGREGMFQEKNQKVSEARRRLRDSSGDFFPRGYNQSDGSHSWDLRQHGEYGVGSMPQKHRGIEISRRDTRPESLL